MKLAIAILTVWLGVAALSAAATACPSHDAQAAAQADQSSTTATAKTTTGKTTGG